MGHRADVEIKNEIKDLSAFRGEVENRDNVGKTSDDLVAMWNEAHPDDPVS